MTTREALPFDPAPLTTLEVRVVVPATYHAEQYQDEAEEALDLIIRLRRAKIPHSEIMRRLGGFVPRDVYEVSP